MRPERENNPAYFDVAKQMKLVPAFIEKDVEAFYRSFKKLAKQQGWPKEKWPLLIAPVLRGRAQLVYSNMSVEDGTDYEKTKAQILVAYELVPEAYRSRFRKYAKRDSDTWVSLCENVRVFLIVG